MADYSLTLTNPDAESGNITGWTLRSGNGAAYSSAELWAARSGTYGFKFNTHATTNLSGAHDTQVTIPAEYLDDIDNGFFVVHGSCWKRTTDSYSSKLYVECYDASLVLLDREEDPYTSEAAFTQKTISFAIPPLTRYIRLGAAYSRTSGGTSQWDDFTLVISDDPAPGINAYQLGAYAAVNYESAGAIASQLGTTALTASEESSGLYVLKAHQLGAYALVLPFADRRDLYAWRFPQDDHEFYVLQLGGDSTLIFDKSTGQWARWKSPDLTYWRGSDGRDWEGFNVCCDSRDGRIWEIDPEGRLDDGDTPITSVVTGMMTQRFANHTPIYRAELAVSEGEPPSGVEEGEVTISLRTIDGLNSYSHGSVIPPDIGEDATIRWYGLGTASAPGRVFEITDTGYARRIDGFNIEVGE
jgi:hypothetical protein